MFLKCAQRASTLNNSEKVTDMIRDYRVSFATVNAAYGLWSGIYNSGCL